MGGFTPPQRAALAKPDAALTKQEVGREGFHPRARAPVATMRPPAIAPGAGA